jgi:hypothetical protein
MKMLGSVLAAALVFGAPVQAVQMLEADSGVLRWIDRLTGEQGDMELARGQSATNGRLTIVMDECRYPADNPAGDAEAHLTISDSLIPKPVFQGWMVASSPALSALDHPRYDVWVLSCVYPGAPDAPLADTAPAEGQ